MKRFPIQYRRSSTLPRHAGQTRQLKHNAAGNCAAKKQFRACVAGLLLIPFTLFAEYNFPIGEKAVYKIKWKFMACGTSTISCDEVERDGKKLIRVRVQAKSNWLVSTIYPVDDTVDCFIDPETKLSVRLEKNTSEGDLVCKDVLILDRDKNQAYWTSQVKNVSTNYPIEAASCDAVSFLYAFRQQEMEEGDSCDFNIAVDTALHGISVTAKGTAKKEIGENEKTMCRKYLVTPKRDDLFIYKIPKEIWITTDERKIMAKMVIQTPVGKARIVLDEYISPH